MTAEETEEPKRKKSPRRLPPETITLQFAGDLILPKSDHPEMAGLFRRYQSLFEAFANMDRDERALNYRFINGLMLTSHAKKTKNIDLRRKLFDLKNQIYFQVAQDRDARRKVVFKYLVSKQFRVEKFCDNCAKANEENEAKPHQRKFCKSCKVDRDFYNVLSMLHKFDDGSASLFLSNDLIHKIPGVNLTRRGKLEEAQEEAVFERYRFNIRNLDAFKLESVLTMNEKLLGKPAGD